MITKSNRESKARGKKKKGKEKKRKYFTARVVSLRKKKRRTCHPAQSMQMQVHRYRNSGGVFSRQMLSPIRMIRSHVRRFRHGLRVPSTPDTYGNMLHTMMYVGGRLYILLYQAVT
jgi:hypothetical protein